MASVLLISLLTLFLTAIRLSRSETLRQPKRATNGLHIPIYKREFPRLYRRAGDATGSIGLGDFQDITYNVLVQVGEIETPLVLDTGSSDLWVISDACKGSSCPSDVTLYPHTSLQSANIDARLFYGDSQSGTHAFGEIGKDTVGVAGLSIRNQYFAAINDTNATVLQTDSAGIFGLGFPVNSVIWSQLFASQFPANVQPPTKHSNLRPSQFPDIPSLFDNTVSGKRTARDPGSSLASWLTRFSDVASSLSSTAASKRKAAAMPSLVDLLVSFGTYGPLLSRFAAQKALSSPQFTVTLQRDTIQFGGNVGMLSVGELPEGVNNSSLTWVPVRRYTSQQGGIQSPTDLYPIAWEVPIDDVFLDGQKLPRSTLSPGVSVTALIDTGNSLIRGPQDVVQTLFTAVTGSGNASTYDCSTPHTMSFQIGGAMFPIDPRDFLRRRETGVKDCFSNVIATDPPQNGFLYSWNLGDPFFKSNLISFYYGNLTHPSEDPPRIGFMSTVPSDANDQLQAAVSSAQANGGNFPAKTEAAPSSNPSIATTISGVPHAETQGPSVGSSSGNGLTQATARASGGHTTYAASWAVLGSFSFVASILV